MKDSRMAWNDDGWKDGYDAWKLRAPDWDDDEPPEDESLDPEFEDRENDYNQYVKHELRLQWWCDLWSSIKSIYRWRRKPNPTDDDIQF